MCRTATARPMRDITATWTADVCRQCCNTSQVWQVTPKGWIPCPTCTQGVDPMPPYSSQEKTIRLVIDELAALIDGRVWDEEGREAFIGTLRTAADELSLIANDLQEES